MKYIVVGMPKGAKTESRRAVGSVAKGLKLAERLVARGWEYAQVEDAPAKERRDYVPPVKRK